MTLDKVPGEPLRDWPFSEEEGWGLMNPPVLK
jgi:hypothetical protein